jgi:hypothetical protein
MKDLETRISTMTDEKHSLFNSLRQLLAEDPPEKKKEEELGPNGTNNTSVNNQNIISPSPSPSPSPAPSQTTPQPSHNVPRNDPRT